MDFNFKFTKSALQAFLPNSKIVDQWHAGLSEQLPKHSINTINRTAAFLAQCSHESAGFTVLVENLNYQSSRLRAVFPKYFHSDTAAKEFANNPQKIANLVYANRMGNGNESSNDGFRFRGRGLIQLTGRANYQEFANSVDMSIDRVPEYLQTVNGAIASACWFWSKHNLNSLADTADIIGITKRINGGTTGLSERVVAYNRCIDLLCGK